jgi:phage recombination protein Bet
MTDAKPGTALALLAQRVAVEPAELEQTLMQTVFKGAKPAEFTMLVALANKYDLDPFAKEINAFAKSGGGIVPLVPIDGWLKVIHRHEDYAGMETIYADEMVEPSQKARRCYEWVETRIYHKSTPDHPTVHREYIDEMYRDTGPWNTTTKRMLEWKSIIQTGRKAFGLAGIFDEDEAERIDAGEMSYDLEGAADDVTGEVIGEADYQQLLAEMKRTGLSEDSVKKNLAVKAGYTGPLADMPVAVFEALMAGLAKMQPGPDDEPTAAPQEAVSDDVEAEGEWEAAQSAPDAPQESESAPEEEPPGMDAEAFKAKRDQDTEPPARPRSAKAAAQRAARNAAERETEKPPAPAKQTMLAAKAAELARIAGADAMCYVLNRFAGVDDVAQVTGAKADEVIEQLQAAIGRARDAGKGAA